MNWVFVVSKIAKFTTTFEFDFRFEKGLFFNRNLNGDVTQKRKIMMLSFLLETLTFSQKQRKKLFNMSMATESSFTRI